MNIQYYLQVLASRILLLANTFAILGGRIANIYLIGQYLSQPFIQTAINLVNVSAFINTIGSNWDVAYNEIRNQLDQILDLRQLQVYASRLIAFILNPTPVIYYVIRTLYPTLGALVDNTYSFIKPIVQSIIRETIGVLQDIRGVVLSVFGEVIQDYNLFRSNPARWVFEKMIAFNPIVSFLLRDPERWIQEKVHQFFPDLWAFLQDPKSFIVEKFVDGMENFADRYLLRLAKLTERIISSLF